MSHYYTSDQDLHNPFKIQGRIGRSVLSLWSDKGIFAKNSIDSATKTLLESTPICGNRILDLGCGSGVVGAYVGKDDEISVIGVDTNKRAVILANKNYALHDVDGTAYVSDGYEAVTGTFSHIITNPPMAAGRSVCERFIRQAPEYLEKNGCFTLVARHKKGGKYLWKVMKDVFETVKVLEKSGGFRVYNAIH